MTATHSIIKYWASTYSFQTEVEVFRRDSRKLPIGDPDVAWEETLYLNLIIHQFEYMLTFAVCTRTSPKNLQVLKRHCQVKFLIHLAIAYLSNEIIFLESLCFS